MKQEAERVSRYARKKKSKGWGVFDVENGSCIFAGRYRECFSLMTKKYPVGYVIRRRAN